MARELGGSGSVSLMDGLTGILLVVGVLAVVGLIFSLVKGVIKMAVLLGLIALGAWYWFFQQ